MMQLGSYVPVLMTCCLHHHVRNVPWR